MNENKFNGNWDDLKEAIQTRWAVLSENELESTEGNFQQMVKLVAAKHPGGEDAIRSELSEIYASHAEGHPKLNDHFAGTDAAINSEDDQGIVVNSRAPHSQEWQAREDVKRSGA